MMPGTWSPPDSPQGPGGVIFPRAMSAEPDIKRAVSFIDGQNLYRHAKDAFGHHHPNYDPSKLAHAVCVNDGWVNPGVRFYTGAPSAHRAPMWHGYWNRRLTAMRRAGIAVTSRPLRYRVETVRRHGTIRSSCCSLHRRIALGSRASCRPSPRKLNAITVMKMSRPGHTASIGASWMSSCALVSMLPQLGVGG